MKIQEILKEYLDMNLEIDSYFKINDQFISANFEYQQLKDTVFEFDYKQKKVLHFTSIESAQLILENNYLRGSNFNKFDDAFEIIDVLSKININLTTGWKKIKAETFAISFTEKSDSQVQNSYKYHWENYANGHKGVAFEFEFTESNLPHDFYPLRIKYIRNSNSIIEKIRNEISMEANMERAEKELLLPILASCKDKDKFYQEKEVRLMYNILESNIEHLDNSLDSDVFFSFKTDEPMNLELRVPYSTEKNNLSQNSILQLKKIYLGNLSLNTCDNISSTLLMRYFEKICKEKGIELNY